MHKKTFYVVSALRNDSGPLGNLKQHDTEAEAVSHAKAVIRMRQEKGQPNMGFYILKVQAFVDVVQPPLKVTRLKGK